MVYDARVTHPHLRVRVREHISQCIKHGDHGSTFAGSPLVCAVAEHILDRVTDPALLRNVTGAFMPTTV